MKKKSAPLTVVDANRKLVHQLLIAVVRGDIRNPYEREVADLVGSNKPVTWTTRWGQVLKDAERDLIPVAEALARDPASRELFLTMLETIRSGKSINKAASRE